MLSALIYGSAGAGTARRRADCILLGEDEIDLATPYPGRRGGR